MAQAGQLLERHLLNPSLQFRVLYRQFLFRLMDVELLSTPAGGDASGLLGQFAALLIFGSVVLTFAAITVGQAIRDGASAASVWSAERFLLSLTMLVVGVFALVSWDSLFPDRRDVLVLAPLPVRGRTMFGAKAAAAASALALTVVAWNCLAAFAWPLVLAPEGTGLLGTVRLVAAFWISLFAAGAFLYCVVLAVQAAAAQLPRPWYLRVSSLLQMAAFVLFLGVTFLQPSVDSAAALAAPENQRTLAWLPSYWFLGLLSEMSGVYRAEGHAAMAPLARRALASLAVAIVLAGGGFLLSYLRTLRKIVEAPDIVPGSRRGIALPRLGSLPQTALAQFVIRTLLRSRQHRVILGFYLGGGFAIAAVYLEGSRSFLHVTWHAMMHRTGAPPMVASVLMLCAAWLGARTVFSLPLDLRANWLFKVTPARGGAAGLAAVRRALFLVAVLPVLAGTAAVLFWFRPPAQAAEHLLLLGLVGSILTDLSLRGFRKIPFTCSYLPGKSKVHLLFWFGVIPVVIAIHRAVGLEVEAMASPVSYWPVAIALGVAAFAARRFAWSAVPHDGEIQFEEAASDELLGLGLNR